MSLIPSESLNFPDSFRAKVGWRVGEPGVDEKALEALRQVIARERAELQTQLVAHAEPAPKPPPPPTPVVAPPATMEPEAQASPVSPAEPPPAAITELPAEPIPSAPGSAEMTALLSHFLASSAANPPPVLPNEELTVSAPEPSAPASTPPVETAPPKQDYASKNVMAVDEPPPETKQEPKPDETPALAEKNFAPPPEKQADNHFAKITPAPPPIRTLPRNSFKILKEPPANGPTALSGANTAKAPEQTPHIFDLITAAIQRGAVVGGNVPAPENEADDASDAETPSSTLPESESVSPESPIGSQAADESAPAQPPVAEATAEDVPKAPAKIRITPRKNIKPRVSAAEPAPPVEELPFPVSDSIAPHESMIDAPVFSPWKLPSNTPESSPITPVREHPWSPPDYSEFLSRSPAASPFEFNETNLNLFTARERRNRWIGFGLSEAAALTALIVLAWFGFTYHFPDPTLKLLVFILFFAAAAVAVILPIVFVRNNPSRWQRER